jgi:putative nucleotidyltransferase with HDIG domain
MGPIVLVCDADERAFDIVSRLGSDFSLNYVSLNRLGESEPAQVSLIDVELRRVRETQNLQRWIRRRPKGSQVIFAIDPASRFDAVQAAALGATAVVHRPVKREQLGLVLNSYSTIINLPVGFDGPAGMIQARLVNALHAAFASTLRGGEFDLQLLQDAGAEVVSQMEEEGLQSWLETVRRHHSLTYQHCLIVTAVAVSFGQHLGFSKNDRERIATAGLLHDIGKARIPIEILEKQGPLTDDEWVIMRMHPELGVDSIGAASGLAPEMIEIVRNHHEYIDGTGYPSGLHGSEISDLVRALTICDVYGALIEKRSYKPPMSGAAAYDVLKKMGPKLDRDMVREFESLTRTIS